MRKLVIGSDHRGYNHKSYLIDMLSSQGYSIEDVGAYSQDSIAYTGISEKLIDTMRKDLDNTLGILICGSGIGISIAANRFKDIRAAVVYNKSVAKSARNHNNANVISMGADCFTKEELLDFVNVFLNEEFEGGRHQVRVDELGKMGN